VVTISALIADIPPGNWIAIDDAETRVLAWGKTVDDVLNRAIAMGEQHPVLIGVPENVVIAIVAI
jgi:hypothetical protein